jgi:hypothetical protein
MSVRSQRFVLPLLGLLFAACATAGYERPSRTEGGVTSRDGAIIISGVALDDGPRSILSAMQGKVPSLRVLRPAGECPKISLRSFVTFQTVVNPHVYVDGTRTSGTCILESLRTQDVESVEVYPMGVTSRPGYSPHAHGLILVFMRSN